MPDNEKEKLDWLNQQVQEIRDIEGFKIKDIALRLGVEPSYLSRCLNGHSPVSDRLIKNFKAKFGAADVDEVREFRDQQSNYIKGQPAGIMQAIREHNADLKRNLDDLRKNIEDLRRENEQISNYINHLKSKE